MTGPAKKANETRIVVVSDIHGEVSAMRWVLRHENADALIFLGDGLRDLHTAIEREKQRAPAAPRPPVYAVRGNCDAGAPDPAEAVVCLGKVLFFYTHGHYYSVKTGTDPLAQIAADRGADVALYGHTHERNLEVPLAQRPAVFNPGALLNGSYGVITAGNGKCRFAWRCVPKFR